MFSISILFHSVKKNYSSYFLFLFDLRRKRPSISKLKKRKIRRDSKLIIIKLLT